MPKVFQTNLFMKLFFFFTIAVSLIFTSVAFGEGVEYVLQPGDVIAISVVEHPEFSGRHKIRPDGRINYPVIGEVDVASLTCAQLVKIMQGKLSSYINNPVISVSIEAYYANRIFVIGHVAKAGEYEIYEPVDVLKVIAMCGGLINPKVKIIKIIRTDGTVVSVPMGEIWGNNSKYDNKKYMLYPGDTMYVPESIQIPWAILSAIFGVLSVSLQVLIAVNSLSR